MSDNEYFRFSVSIHCNDFPLIAAMRGLAWFCQPEICRQTSVFGTKEGDWQREGHKVSFHFTSDGNRQKFINECRRLFPPSWEIAAQKDNNPPKR
jgi:hypothetical protein